MIPTSIDGTDITGATIDGTDVTEITVDGDTVFTAGPDIPDSQDLHAHYDATLLSLSDGDPVSTWQDQSGNGHDLTQGTATEQPTYKTGVLNGKPVVRHDGSDDYLEVSFSSISQPNHIFAVFQGLSTGGYVYGGGSSSTRHDLGSSIGSSGFFVQAGNGLLSGLPSDTSPHLFSTLYDGGSSVIRVEGTEEASGNAGSDNLDGFKTGTFGGATGSFGNFDIAEILIYPQDKTSIVSDVESYLSNKWGITI